MQSKNKRLLRQRAVSWNVLSGNVSNPSMMRIPLVTNTIRTPLVTWGVLHISPHPLKGLVNAKPPITSWKYLGMPPTGLVPGEIPRSRGATPLEYDLLEFLFGVIAAPVVLPALMLRSVAEAPEEQTRYEANIEAMLRDELLENEMRYESGEISEEDHRKRKAALTQRLKELDK